MASAAIILLDGLAYGMVLFIISVGLTVTMGLMRVVNLAHGGFAMAGGYLAAVMVVGRHSVHHCARSSRPRPPGLSARCASSPCFARSTARASWRRC